MSARVRSSTNSYNQPWVADLSSTYVVNGEVLLGFSSDQSAQRGPHRGKDRGLEGQKVVVRYSPDKNDLSALRRGDQVGGQSGN
jgi:hypothetical protein